MVSKSSSLKEMSEKEITSETFETFETSVPVETTDFNSLYPSIAPSFFQFEVFQPSPGKSQGLEALLRHFQLERAILRTPRR